MKRLLPVLVLLCLAVPVNATVFIYNAKESISGVELEGIDYGQNFKEKELAYIVIDFTAANKANVWAVYLYKRKDASGTWKWLETEEWSEMDFFTPIIKDKYTWIVSGGDDEHRVLLTGREKFSKIGDSLWYSAPSMTGILMWEDVYVSGRQMCVSKLSLRLDSKTMVKVFGGVNASINAVNAKDALVNYLVTFEDYHLHP